MCSCFIAETLYRATFSKNVEATRTKLDKRFQLLPQQHQLPSVWHSHLRHVAFLCHSPMDVPISNQVRASQIFQLKELKFCPCILNVKETWEQWEWWKLLAFDGPDWQDHWHKPAFPCYPGKLPFNHWQASGNDTNRMKSSFPVGHPSRDLFTRARERTSSYRHDNLRQASKELHSSNRWKETSNAYGKHGVNKWLIDERILTSHSNRVDEDIVIQKVRKESEWLTPSWCCKMAIASSKLSVFGPVCFLPTKNSTCLAACSHWIS